MNPGSNEAIEAGCTCPVIDNSHGWGYTGKGIFVMHDACPIHGLDKDVDLDDIKEDLLA